MVHLKEFAEGAEDRIIDRSDYYVILEGCTLGNGVINSTPYLLLKAGDTLSSKDIAKIGASLAEWIQDPFPNISPSIPGNADIFLSSIRDAARAESRMMLNLAENERVTPYASLVGKLETDVAAVRDYDCGQSPVSILESYSVCGGSEEAFEFVTLELNRKALMRQYPDFDSTGDSSIDIVDSVSTIRISGIGEGEYIIASHSYSSDKLKLTAYCKANKYCSALLKSDMFGTPEKIITDILTDSSFGVSYSKNDIVWLYDDAEGFSLSGVFESCAKCRAGATAWEVIQACAVILGCKVFFTARNAFIVDTSMLDEIEELYEGRNVELNSKGRDAAGEGYADWTRTVIDSVSLGDEGLNTIINRITLSYSEAADMTDGSTGFETVKVTIPSLSGVSSDEEDNRRRTQLSETIYGRYLANMSIADIIVPVDKKSNKDFKSMIVTAFTRYLEYRIMPQTSIRFEMNEAGIKDGRLTWIPRIQEVHAVRAFHSEEDGIFVSNRDILSDDADDVAPQRLTLSRYVHRYPSMTSEYTFGVASNISLSQTTSQITSQLR